MRRLPGQPADVRLRRDRRGSGSLEFALVAIPFITFLLFLLEIGYDSFAQVALNYGVQVAARQIQVGHVQGVNTAAAFRAKYLCPALAGLLPCSAILVNIRPISTDFYTAVAGTLPRDAAGRLDTSGFTYCPGKPNQLMLAEAIYTSPSLISAVIPDMATAVVGSFAHVTMASTAFINEDFPINAAPPAGC